MNPRFLLLSFAICLVLSSSAWAGFTIVNSPAAATQSDAPTVLPPGVSNQLAANQPPDWPPPALIPAAASGNVAPAMATASPPPVYASNVVNGFGHDIPLGIAVKQIVPTGTNVVFDPSVDTSMPVNWRGGQSWQQVLADTLGPNSLYMYMSENGNSVLINTTRPALANAQPAPMMTMMNPPPVIPTVIPTAAPVAAPAPAPVYTPVSATSNIPPVMVPAPMTASMPVMKPVPVNLPSVALPPMEVPTWTAKTSDTLHQTLEAWCKKANVSLRWDSEFDYPIETNISLTGDFETSVRALLGGLKNANPRPVAHYYRAKEGVQEAVLLVPSPGLDNPLHVSADETISAPESLPPISNAPPAN